MFSDTFGTTYNKICRICLKGCDSSIHIFSNIHISSDKLLKECIEDISDILISPDDNLPDSICTKCLEQLDQCYNFRILARKTDEFLHKILEGDFLDDSKEDADADAIHQEDEEIEGTHEDEIEKSDCDSKMFLQDCKEDEPTVLEVDQISQDCGEFREESDGDAEVMDSKQFIEEYQSPEEALAEMVINNQTEESEITEQTFEGELLEGIIVEKPKEKKFHCEYCGVGFVYLKNKKQHVKRHIREGSRECPLCQRKFYTNYDLKRHLFTHKNEKKYKCEKCNKVYLTQSELNRHLKTHEAVRKYKCGHCTRDFFELGVLNFHVKTVHLSERRHQCNTCGKCFTTGSKVRRHQKSRSCGQRKTVTTVHSENQFMILEESDIVYNSEDEEW